MFLCLGFLEDCGYMVWIVFVMDCLFWKFGLFGKLFILMLIVIGCGVLGVMVSWMIENECDWWMIIMVMIFMLCLVKLLIIVLIVGVFFFN